MVIICNESAIIVASVVATAMLAVNAPDTGAATVNISNNN